MEEIVAIARKAGAYVLSDEVYRGLSEDGSYMTSIVDIYEKGVSVGSTSKIFSLAGLRLGWIVTRDLDLIHQLHERRDYDTISCGVIDDMLAAMALANKEKIYARNNIEIVMTIKKTLSLDSPDTCIKVEFNPDDTVDEVYEKFNAVVEEIQSRPDDKSEFDKLNKLLTRIPGLLCRWTVKALSFGDYFGWLPKSLLRLSPFHGSMIITSMGSLGIRPIYHHIYNFGNLPVFIAYGSRRAVVCCDKDGKASVKKYIEMKAVTDERICDGFYYASAFKIIKRHVENPELLEQRPEQVYEDID